MASNEQFGRKIKFVLYPSDNQSEPIDLSQFRITFETVIDDRENPNHANIRIFNLSRELSKKIINQEFSYVQIDAGYEGNIGTIFLGTVRYARAGRSDRSDSYTDILAYDWDLFYGSAILNKSFAAGSTPKDIFDSIVSDSKVPTAKDNLQKSFQAQKALSGAAQDAIAYYDSKQAEELPRTPYVRGKVCYDMSRDCLRKMATNYGFNWSIQRGKLLLIPKQGVVNQVNVVNNTTGLIGFPEIHIDGIHLKILLNPNIIIGSIIQLENASITGRAPGASVGLQSGVRNDAITPEVDGKGEYRVLSVTHTGDTRGQPWYSNIICLSLDNFTKQTGGISSIGLLERVTGALGVFQNSTSK